MEGPEGKAQVSVTGVESAFRALEGLVVGSGGLHFGGAAVRHGGAYHQDIAAGSASGPHRR